MQAILLKPYRKLLILIILCSFFYVRQSSDQFIQFDLIRDNDWSLTTYIQIGNIQQKMNIDINYGRVSICCKNTNSIFHKIYYFLINPFFQVYDYSCRYTSNQLATDTAKFGKLGLIQIQFQQQQFPSCSKGILGLNRKAYINSKMPINMESFVISKIQGELNKYTLKFGDDTPQDFYYTKTLSNQTWIVRPSNIKFNQVLMQNNPVMLSTIGDTIKIPFSSYDFIVHQLSSNFECKKIDNELFCPCQSGNLNNYPKFELSFGNSFNLQIYPIQYMEQDSQTCKVLVEAHGDQAIILNIVFLKDIVAKFDPVNGRVGLLIKNVDPKNHQRIKLPLQLILNCSVILLLCIFVALVMIQIIKRVSGLADVREQIFRVDTPQKTSKRYYE